MFAGLCGEEVLITVGIPMLNRHDTAFTNNCRCTLHTFKNDDAYLVADP